LLAFGPVERQIRRSTGQNTDLLNLSGAVWTDRASNVSSQDPSEADQIDAEHPSRNRKIGTCSA
jgi:hypothetical protein